MTAANGNVVESPPAGTLEYNSSNKSGCLIAFYIALSAACLIFGAAFFTMGFVIPDLSGSTSFMIILNVSIIFFLLGTISVVSKLRMPIRLVLDRDGILLEGRISRRRIAWAEISSIEPGKEFQWGLSGNNQMEVIVLKDTVGKKLATIPSDFQPFAELAAQIKDRSSRAAGHETFSLDKEKERSSRQAKKKQFWAKVAMPFAVAMGFLMVGMGTWQQLEENAICRKGRDIDAEITKRYLYNDFAPRLEYRFNDENGNSVTNNVLMKHKEWKQLDGTKTVAIRYLPGKPSVNRPVEGFDSGMQSSPWLMIILGVVFIFMFGGMLGVVAMGYDIESKDGRLRIKRLDETTSLIPDNEGSASRPPPPIPPPLPPTDQSASIAEDIRTARPVGITVLAAINIAYGAFGILFNSGLLLLVLLMANQPLLQSGNVAFAPDTSFVAIAGICIKWILALLLVVSAFGLLSMRRWGRNLALGTAAGQCVMCVAHILISLYNVMAAREAYDVLGKTGFTVTLIFSLFLISLGLIYPAILLVLLGRRETRKLFTK